MSKPLVTNYTKPKYRRVTVGCTVTHDGTTYTLHVELNPTDSPEVMLSDLEARLNQFVKRKVDYANE